MASAQRLGQHGRRRRNGWRGFATRRGIAEGPDDQVLGKRRTQHKFIQPGHSHCRKGRCGVFLVRFG